MHEGKGLSSSSQTVALPAQIGPDEAEDEDFGDSKARTTTKYGPICAATRRDGADFSDFVVARRSSRLATARSSLLELQKISPVAIGLRT